MMKTGLYIASIMAGAAFAGCHTYESDVTSMEIAREEAKLEALMEQAKLKSEGERLESKIKIVKGVFVTKAMVNDAEKKQAKINEGMKEYLRLQTCVEEILEKADIQRIADVDNFPTRKNPGSVKSGCLYAVEFDKDDNTMIYIKPTKDRKQGFVEVRTFFRMLDKKSQHLGKELKEVGQVLNAAKEKGRETLEAIK